MRTINWGESAKPWEGREQDCGSVEEQTKNGKQHLRGLRSRGSGLEGGHEGQRGERNDIGTP